jgi:hypothetical protein
MSAPYDPFPAITEVAKAVQQISAQTHPLIYFWRMHRLTRLIVKECKNNKNLIPADVVGEYCHDLDKEEQTFILHVVNESLWSE